MNKRRTFPFLVVMTMLVLQACNLLDASATEEPTVDPLIAAGMTLTASADLDPPTEIPPTFTPAPLPTFSPIPELTATSDFTPTPTFAYLTLSSATNCRVGPGRGYKRVDVFRVGQTIEVIGKHPFDNYWYVRSPVNAAVQCWMWGFYATGGNLNNVPVLTPPPTLTPSPAPDFSLSYVNSGKCITWWTRINLNNTGPAAFRSMSITIKDTVTNETLNASSDGFQDVNACILSTVNSVLATGESYTIVAPSFSADPAGHKVTASITLCTEIGQGGTCIPETIEFTP